jgi:CRISPR-associated protein Cas1
MKSKVLKLVLDDYGSYLGMEKGCFTVKDKHGNVQRYPMLEYEIGEVILKSGNIVSTGALASLGFWNIDCLILTQKGRPVAMLKSLDDESHVQTRISQYEALNNGKGLTIAKEFLIAKLKGQNQVLQKYGLSGINFSVFEMIKKLEAYNLTILRKKLLAIEGKCSTNYFTSVFGLFNESVKPSNRRTFKAYDGLNNLFNLGYEMLAWKIHIALVKAKLEPYLGFLHTLKFGMPSLVCDFLELYCFLIDDFVIEFGRGLKRKDFIVKSGNFSKNRKGKRQYLNMKGTTVFTKKLNNFFESMVDIPRIMHGERQTLDTLINEEASLLAKFLRNEREMWTPRFPSL